MAPRNQILGKNNVTHVVTQLFWLAQLPFQKDIQPPYRHANYKSHGLWVGLAKVNLVYGKSWVAYNGQDKESMPLLSRVMDLGSSNCGKPFCLVHDKYLIL